MKSMSWKIVAVLSLFATKLCAQTGPFLKDSLRYDYRSDLTGSCYNYSELNSEMQQDGLRIISHNNTSIARLHYTRNWLTDTAVIRSAKVQLNAFFIFPSESSYKTINIPELKERAIPHGLYTKTILHSNGKIVSIEKYTYSYGRKNGSCEEYSLNPWEYKGNGVWKRYTMKEDVLDGLYLEQRENGDTLEYGLYSNNRKEGCWRTINYRQGYKTLCCYQNGLRHGVYKFWNQSGVLLNEAFYISDRKDGWSRSWYGNGQLSSEDYYKNGVIQKTSKSWYGNGRLLYLAEYDSLGQHHGVAEKYFENGQVNYRQHYIHGKLEGVSNTWNINGVLVERIHYHNGAREGKSEYFFDSGKLMQEEYYLHGELNGILKVWDEKGKLTRHELYKNGIFVKSYLKPELYDTEVLFDAPYGTASDGPYGVGDMEGGSGEYDNDYEGKALRFRIENSSLPCVREYAGTLTDTLNAYYLQLSKKEKKKWDKIGELEVTLYVQPDRCVPSVGRVEDEKLKIELLEFCRRLLVYKNCYSSSAYTITIYIPRQEKTEKH